MLRMVRATRSGGGYRLPLVRLDLRDEAVAVLGHGSLVWINLAIGFIGNEDNPLNLAYFAMLAVVPIAGAIFRFRANAMAGLMVFCAVAQLAILLLRRQEMGFEWVATGVVCLGWLSLAALFRKAAQR